LGKAEVLIYSLWGDLAHGLAFEAGWWSVGAWVALVAAFAPTAILVKAGTEPIVGIVFVSGPTAAVVIFGLLMQFADPNPGCTYDCQGRWLVLGPSGGWLIGWGLGFMTGALWRRVERQRA
jgi:hypothetical protein